MDYLDKLARALPTVRICLTALLLVGGGCGYRGYRHATAGYGHRFAGSNEGGREHLALTGSHSIGATLSAFTLRTKLAPDVQQVALGVDGSLPLDHFVPRAGIHLIQVDHVRDSNGDSTLSLGTLSPYLEIIFGVLGRSGDNKTSVVTVSASVEYDVRFGERPDDICASVLVGLGQILFKE